MEREVHVLTRRFEESPHLPAARPKIDRCRLPGSPEADGTPTALWLVEWFVLPPLPQSRAISDWCENFEICADRLALAATRDREIGNRNKENVSQLLYSQVLYPFTERLGMSMQELLVLVAHARHEAADVTLKPYFPLFVTRPRPSTDEQLLANLVQVCVCCSKATMLNRKQSGVIQIVISPGSDVAQRSCIDLVLDLISGVWVGIN